MAKSLFTTSISGNEDILKELDLIADNLSSMTFEAVKAQEEVIQEAIKVNWVTLANGKNNDYVYDSIGYSTHFGSNGTDVIGTVGVYNLDSVTSAHGKTKGKSLNAAQIAYWVEFGTSRLRSGGRKVKGAKYDETELITNSPKPFISNAFYNTLNEQRQAFYDKFKEQLDNIKG